MNRPPRTTLARALVPAAVLSSAFAAGVVVLACAGTLDDPERFTTSSAAASGDGASDAPACPDMVALMAQKCATSLCHSAKDKASGLDLASPNIASRLVNVPATNSGFLVDSANPSQSVMYARIQPTAAGRMPVSGDALDNATIACMLSWMAGLGSASPSPTSTATTSPTTPTGDGGTLPTDAGARPTIRVVAGGPAYTDHAGAVWSADTGFTGGKTDDTVSTVNGTQDAPLYYGQRYAQNPADGTAQPFSYAFTVPNGSYVVTLKFAELYTGITAAGQRVFNVAINGATVLPNFDIYAAAGNARDTPVDKPFPVMVTTGKIQIDFTNGAANFAKVDSLMIAPQ